VVDLVCHLVAASLVVVMGAVSLAFLITLILMAVVAPAGLLQVLTSHDGLPVMALYLLSFGLSPIYGAVYWLRDPDTSLVKTIGYAHLFTVYAYIWVPAGWGALWRLASGRRDWAKTARNVEIIQEAHA
jgi:hypothetical protein